MFRDWISRSLERRLLLSLLLGVGLSLAAFQIVVDQLVDRYIARSFDARSADGAERDRLLREVDIVLFAGVVTVLGACALITIVSVRRGLKPLAVAAAAARGVSVEQPARSLPLAGLPAEIRPLGERINALLQAQAESLERERRFSTDLAHELRTALAEIRALGEVGLTRTDTAGLHEFLRQTTAAAIGMQGVIESLLAVARADRIAVQRALEPFQAATVIRTQIERARLAAAAHAERIVCRVPEQVWIHSDPRLFAAILQNLLSNALQHGDAREPIEIDWLPAPGAAALQVRNPAPALSPEDLPHLTERFWRRAPQEAAAGTGGLGLGLWVVASLCRVLDLELAFELDAERRLGVRVSGFRPV